MLLFCPICHNLLQISRTRPVENTDPGRARFECQTCPYQFILTQPIWERNVMKRKEVEDVLGGKEAWENVDKTDIACPRDDCEGTQAFFNQIQIRSADEPMTLFYKCTTCGKTWKEN